MSMVRSWNIFYATSKKKKKKYMICTNWIKFRQDKHSNFPWAAISFKCIRLNARDLSSFDTVKLKEVFRSCLCHLFTALQVWRIYNRLKQPKNPTPRTAICNSVIPPLSPTILTVVLAWLLVMQLPYHITLNLQNRLCCQTGGWALHMGCLK